MSGPEPVEDPRRPDAGAAVPGEGPGDQHSDERLHDLSDSVELEALPAPEEWGPGAPDVDAAVMVRLIVAGKVVEYVECSRRTDKNLYLANVGDVWVRWRIKDSIPVVQRIFVVLAFAVAIPAVAMMAMIFLEADWIAMVSAGVLGFLAAVTMIIKKLESMSAVDVSWGRWVKMPAGAWAGLLDHARERISEGVDSQVVVSMMDMVVYGHRSDD